ncbi:hypothetical protein L596_000998 [Steinernema carpocapsae]|uniref:Uncharacterized protein n=1 Tax=Steinernema carpocapsae TaxID=34508 RepID=A0A4U8UKB7_STECR|nr:hypothetical protein L596_000998 [Steinernema carpocapsae]
MIEIVKLKIDRKDIAERRIFAITEEFKGLFALSSGITEIPCLIKLVVAVDCYFRASAACHPFDVLALLRFPESHNSTTELAGKKHNSPSVPEFAAKTG